MSIAAKTKPELVVLGTVSRTQERTKKDSGEVYGGLILVESPSGALWVQTWDRDLPELPPIGQFLAWFVVVDDDPKYGGSLTYSRPVNAGDLDRIASSVAPSGK